MICGWSLVFYFWDLNFRRQLLNAPPKLLQSLPGLVQPSWYLELGLRHPDDSTEENGRSQPEKEHTKRKAMGFDVYPIARPEF